MEYLLISAHSLLYKTILSVQVSWLVAASIISKVYNWMSFFIPGVGIIIVWLCMSFVPLRNSFLFWTEFICCLQCIPALFFVHAFSSLSLHFLFTFSSLSLHFLFTFSSLSPYFLFTFSSLSLHFLFTSTIL